MPATATERWSDRKLVKGIDNAWTATRAFDVINATTDNDVFTATLTGAASGLVPVINEEHDLQSRLRVSNLAVDPPGFNLRKLTVTYTIPADGSSHGGGEDNPLSQPMRFRWRRTSTQEEVDQDVYGNPILNSARMPFSQPALRQMTNRILECRRYEPYYDLAKSELYENKVNLGTFTITGVVSVGEGFCRCNLIAPTDEYTTAAEYVEILYELEFDLLGFQSRHIDEGSMVHVGSGELKEIYDSSGNRVSSPILLAGDGTALSSQFRAGSTTGITQVGYTVLPDGATLETSASASFLLYKHHLPISFGGLF